MFRRLLTVLACAVLSAPSFAATTGIVMNADGQPIAGARVTAYRYESAEARHDRLRSESPQRVAVVAAATDERGRFSIDIPKDLPVATLQFEADGYAPFSLRAERDDNLGAFALARADKKSGRVTAGGKPVAGARVIWSGGTAELLFMTDESGAYAVPDPAKWANSVHVLHSSYAPAIEPVFFGFGSAQKPRLDIALQPGVTVSGSVRTADGKSPVAGAVVKIGAWATATSGEDGTFTIEHVPEKWESVTARSGNLSGRRARGGSLDIRVAPTIDIRGVIQDAKSRVPIAGAVVNIASSARLGAGSAEATVSDEKGNFIIRDVAPGSYNLFANHPSFSFTPVSTTISARDNSMRTVAGTRRARVSGAVTAEDRTAVGGARIVALPAARRDFAPNFFGSNIHMSAPDGTFTILAAPDEDLQIEARKKGFPVARSNTLKLAPGERKNGVVITIPAGLSVTGRVVDREGNPLSGVSVSAAESQDANTSRMMRMQRGRTEDDLVQTSSEGTFALKLKEGTYDLAFRREGFAPKTVRAQRVAAAMDPIDVTLEAGVEITGRVTRNGVGIGDVRVSVFGDAAQESTQTSADGSFRFSDLAPGSLMLSAIKEDEFIQINQPVKAPARDVELKVSPGGRISGRVFDKETKQPVTTFEAGLSGSRGGSGMMFIVPNQMRPFTNDDGSFTLENVPPGAATVVVVGGGYVMGVVSNLKVEEGRVLENVEVGLERGVRVTGRVTGPDGAALSGVAVRITERQQDRFVRPTAFAAAATTDANGQYTIEAVEPGEQTFLFMRSGYAQTEKTEKVAGAEVRVDAQLSAGVRVSGTVVTEAGAPVADAAVSAFTTGAAGGGRSTRTDANGAFQLEGLTPGRYTFRATKPGFPPADLRDVDIATAAQPRLVMTSGGTIYGRIIGLPVEDLATVQVTAFAASGSSASATTDASGNYRIEGSPVGTVRLMARSGGMAGGRTAPQTSVQVAPGSAIQHDIEFSAGTTIRGRVTRDGRNVANGYISFGPREALARTSARGQTDANGVYELSGLDHGTYNVLVGDMGGGAPYTTTYEVRGPATFDIDIRTAAISGRVIDASTGRAIEGAGVQLRSGDSGAMRFPMMTVMSDANGAFSMHDVGAGSYYVSAEKEGYATKVVDVNTTESTPHVDIKLSPNPGVTVRVVDARDGRGLGATVRVFDAQNRVVYETPSAYGPGGRPDTVKIGLESGTYRAEVFAGGYASQTVRLTSPGSITVGMTPGGSLVIRSKGSEPRRARLLVGGQVWPRGIFTIDPAPGVMPLNNIAPGTYTVQILGARGDVAASGEVTVTEGGTATIEI